MRNFPPHIKAMAQAILKAERPEPMLADALEELGLSHTAQHFRGNSIHEAGSGDCNVSRMLLGEMLDSKRKWTGPFTLIRDEIANYRNG